MSKTEFVICTQNTGFEASLEVRKLYRVVPDPHAMKIRQVRVCDESGEDYLYPVEYFAPIDLPAAVADRVVNSV